VAVCCSIREAGIDVARCFEPFQVLVLEGDFQRAKVVLELRHVVRADQRNDHARLLPDPRDGDLRRLAPKLPRDADHFFGDVEIALNLCGSLLRATFFGRVLPVVLA